MAKSKTNSYVITLKLYPNKNDLIVLNHRFNIVHHITNVIIKHTKGRIDQLERNKEYRNILLNTKGRKLNTNEIKKLNEIRLSLSISEYNFHSYVNKQKYLYEDNIDIHVAQKIATKVWRATEKYLFSNGNEIHYKRLEEINSFEGKSNSSGLRYRDGYLYHKGLKIKTKFKKTDKYINHALNNDRIKYCRIKRKWFKHNYRYYVDLIMEGTPPNRNIKNIDGNVGIDIGPSSIAVSSNSGCILKELGSGINSIENEIHILNRKLDRQRRINNPQNYNKDGTVKKDTKTFKKVWYKSNNQKLTEDKLKHLYQKRSNKLRQSHIDLANEILNLGSNVIVEDMNFSALAKRSSKIEISEKTGRNKSKKRFGKSINNHAPSLLLKIINTKLKYINKEIIKVNCFKTAATKFNHISGELMDVSLKDRYVEIGDYIIQRDLHSAFNIQHIVNDEYDIDSMNQDFNTFVNMHNSTINELIKLKQLGHKYPSCMGI